MAWASARAVAAPTREPQPQAQWLRTRARSVTVGTLEVRLAKLKETFQALKDSGCGDERGGKPTKKDDFQSPIKPNDYVELRLNTMLHFYQRRIPWLSLQICVVKRVQRVPTGALCTVCVGILLTR